VQVAGFVLPLVEYAGQRKAVCVMKRILSLTVLLLCLLFNSVSAVTPVQLDDASSLNEIVERYNDLAERVNSDNYEGYMREMIPNSFVQSNESMMPYTTTYISTNIFTGASVLACVNGDGLVSGFMIVVPNSQSSYLCAFIASQLIAVLDSSLPYRDIQNTCVRSLDMQDTNMIYSVRHKRGFVVKGDNSDANYVLLIMAGA
jgi:hypothetical protein